MATTEQEGGGQNELQALPTSKCGDQLDRGKAGGGPPLGHGIDRNRQDGHDTDRY